MEGVAKVGEFTTFLWKVANVKDICGTPLHDSPPRVSLSGRYLPDYPRHILFP